jgi:parvulin-like peptidyl-prolyl isomerase
MAPEPDRVLLQHVLISFRDTPVGAPRSREEAESLAAQVLSRALAGEDFSALVRQMSDDPPAPGAEPPGALRVLNHGARGDGSFERAVSELNRRAAQRQAELESRVVGGELAVADAEAEMERFLEALRTESDAARAGAGYPRAALVPAFGDVGFRLAPGAVGVAPHDERSSPFGWHVIKRLE